VQLITQTVLLDLVGIAFYVLVFNLRRIDVRALGLLPEWAHRLFTKDGAPSQGLRLLILFVPLLVAGLIGSLWNLVFEGDVLGNPREEWARNFGVGQSEYVEWHRIMFINGAVMIGIGCLGGIVALLSRWQNPMGKAFFVALPLFYACAWFLYWYVPFATLHSAFYYFFYFQLLASAALLYLLYRAFIK
jgi:hypothetical protein